METRLYAANFHTGHVDVFDSSFTRLDREHGFRDRKLPHGYAPFNVQELGGMLYVTYAKQDARGMDEIAGAGRGFVDVYTTHGRLVKRLVRRGKLDAPWGLAIAPAGFGDLAGALLVGNFGDGRIHAYSPRSGRPLATLRDTHGAPLWIDGLWALRAGDGTTGATSQVVFSAGPAGETHGLVGALSARDDD